ANLTERRSEILPLQFDGLQLRGKCDHFIFWKVGTFVSSKWRVELTRTVVPAESVVTVTVEIDEQTSSPCAWLALVEFVAKRVVTVFRVVLIGKEVLASSNKFHPFHLQQC